MVGNGAFSHKIEFLNLRGHQNWFKRYCNFAEKREFFLLDKVVKLVDGGSDINICPQPPVRP